MAEAQAMSDGFLRMEAAGLLLQEKYVDNLETNQVVMLAEQLEVLLDEMKARSRRSPCGSATHGPQSRRQRFVDRGSGRAEPSQPRAQWI